MTWRGKEKDMTKDNFSDYMLVLAPKDRKEPVWGGVSGHIYIGGDESSAECRIQRNRCRPKA